MSIPNGIRKPDTYIDINLNAQRTGLPANVHKVLFITDDVYNPHQILEPNDGLIASDVIEVPNEPLTNLPINIYDKAQADQIFGQNSIAGRMITAAIKTNRIVDAQCLGKFEIPT